MNREERMEMPWKCKWFGHDWNTHVGFPMKRDCERCGYREKERDKCGLPIRWIQDAN